MLNKISVIFLCLLLAGCGFLFGDHPFSKAPKSSGKLDKTPEVLVSISPHDMVCASPKTGTAAVTIFIQLYWLPPQNIEVTINDQHQFILGSTGKSATVLTLQKVRPGSHEIKIRLENGRVTTKRFSVWECERPNL